LEEKNTEIKILFNWILFYIFFQKKIYLKFAKIEIRIS
jgi:hypothetical protein